LRFLISPEGAQCPCWRRNGRELFYLGLHGRAGQPEPLFTIDTEVLSANHTVASFDVSADGSRFVIPSMTAGESSAPVVSQDWESPVAPKQHRSNQFLGAEVTG
jgi:hypothetical protein